MLQQKIYFLLHFSTSWEIIECGGLLHDLYKLCFIVLCVETIFVLHIVKHPWGRDVVVGPWWFMASAIPVVIILATMPRQSWGFIAPPQCGITRGSEYGITTIVVIIVSIVNSFIVNVYRLWVFLGGKKTKEIGFFWMWYRANSLCRFHLSGNFAQLTIQI